MNSAKLYDKVLAARLQHALLLERTLLALAKRLAKGEDEEARKRYEWYAAQAKAFPTKDLVTVGKSCQEEQDGFEGFEDD